MAIVDTLLTLITVVDILFAIHVVFFARKTPSATLAWLAVLVLLPALGFILYVFLGQDYRRRRMFRLKSDVDQILTGIVEQETHELEAHDVPTTTLRLPDPLRRVALMLLKNNRAVLTAGNDVTIYTDGKKKFADLVTAIRGAQDHVHLEYYIWRNDELSSELRAALTERARSGVAVRLLCDGLGCAHLPRHFFRELKQAGGQVAFFFPSLTRLINLRSNYRNHRKIAVIDGTTCFVGGFNIGDEYLGKVKKWGYWRDAAVRIDGPASLSCQLRFFLDWNYAAKSYRLEFDPRYFPDVPDVFKDQQPLHGVPVQIISSGPDTYWSPIKEYYLKLVDTATESVYIQTPYFIPDESIRDMLRIAALSGLDVRVMIPNRPDHPFVYWASLSYAGQLLSAGVRVYTYDNGFLHAKTIVADETAASVGSANWDIRSFDLNFETNALMYDTDVAKSLKQAFLNDLEICTELTPERYANRSVAVKVKESISRLFSALL